MIQMSLSDQVRYADLLARVLTVVGVLCLGIGFGYWMATATVTNESVSATAYATVFSARAAWGLGAGIIAIVAGAGVEYGTRKMLDVEGGASADA